MSRFATISHWPFWIMTYDKQKRRRHLLGSHRTLHDRPLRGIGTFIRLQLNEWNLCNINLNKRVTNSSLAGETRHRAIRDTSLYIYFSCDQAALRKPLSFCLSVCLSVRPSVCLSVTPFSLCSRHRIITKFSGVITNDKSDIHAKGQGHRSKIKVTVVITPLSRFRTVTPVWIRIWWWNDA